MALNASMDVASDAECPYWDQASLNNTKSKRVMAILVLLQWCRWWYSYGQYCADCIVKLIKVMDMLIVTLKDESKLLAVHAVNATPKLKVMDY